MMARHWGEAESATLARLQNEGKAAFQIAAAMGRPLNAIIGRMKAARKQEAWKAEESEKLTRLLGDGKSAAQIAALMGRTRNAVIGKMTRLREERGEAKPVSRRGPQRKPHPHDAAIAQMARNGMSVTEMARRLVMDESALRYRVKVLKLKVARTATTCLAVRLQGRKEVAAKTDAAIESGLRAFHGTGVSLLTATESACRWPLDGKAADGHPQCCGDARLTGFSYCARHARIGMPKMFGAAEVAS